MSEYAQQYGMYIIFGMTEKEEEPIYDDGGCRGSADSRKKAEGRKVIEAAI